MSHASFCSCDSLHRFHLCVALLIHSVANMSDVWLICSDITCCMLSTIMNTTFNSFAYALHKMSRNVESQVSQGWTFFWQQISVRWNLLHLHATRVATVNRNVAQPQAVDISFVCIPMHFMPFKPLIHHKRGDFHFHLMLMMEQPKFNFSLFAR